MEKFLKQTKSCGPFQTWIYIATAIAPGVPVVMALTFMSFGIYNPGWTCRPKVNASQSLNITTLYPMMSWNDSLETTLVGADYSNDTTEKHALSSCASVNLCESFIFNRKASTIVTEWGLVCDKDWIPPLIISIQMTGDLVGTLMAGEIGDRWGRKAGLFGSILFLCLTLVVSIFSPSWEVFAALRFFVGLGEGSTLAMMLVYPYEFLTSKWRGNVLFIPVWNIMYIIHAFFMWLLKDWRNLHIAAAVMAVVTFLPIFCIPESLRWSAVHGKKKQAATITKTMARMNKTREPSQELVEEIFKETWESVTPTPSYRVLFTNGLWSLTIPLCLAWMLVSLVYFVMYFGVQALSGNFYLNFFLISTCGVAKGLLAAPATRLLGRTRSCGLLYFLATLDLTAVVAVDYFLPSEQAGPIITGLALTLSCLLEAMWDVITVLTAELFPTVIRAHATSFAAMAARIGAILAPILIPENSASLRVPYAVMAGFSFFCSAMILTLPETRDKELEDTIGAKIPRRNIKTTSVDQAHVQDVGEQMLNI